MPISDITTPTVIPGLVASAADLNNASGRQLGSDTKPKDRVAETTTPEVSNTQTPAETEEASKFSEELTKEAALFGVDISGFTDEANASFAIKQAVERTSRDGFNQPPANQGNPIEGEDPAEDEEFDYAAITDPKVAAHVRKLQEEAAKARKTVESIAKQQASERQAVVDHHFKGLVARATKKLDEFKSADFGVGENLNLNQQLNRRNLMELTTNIMNGQTVQGRHIEIEDAIKWAAVMMGKSANEREPAAQNRSLPPGSKGAQGPAKGKRPFFGSARPDWDITGIAHNPIMQKGLAEIAASRS